MRNSVTLAPVVGNKLPAAVENRRCCGTIAYRRRWTVFFGASENDRKRFPSAIMPVLVCAKVSRPFMFSQEPSAALFIDSITRSRGTFHTGLHNVGKVSESITPLCGCPRALASNLSPRINNVRSSDIFLQLSTDVFARLHSKMKSSICHCSHHLFFNSR